MVPSRRSALWGALFVALACRWAAAETLDVKIVAGPASPQPALIGETVSAGLTAIVTGAPTANAELLIVGPEWTWTAGTPSLSGAAAMLTSQGPAAILSLQSAAHGTASVPVTVTCSYSDPATGKAWSGSDSTTVSAVFTELVDVTVSGAQHKVYEDASEVWGAPRRPDTEQAPAPKVGLIAVFEPSISATDAERLLSWSGGEAGADVLSRLVPTTAAGLYAVTASADKSITRTIKVAAWTDGEAPTVELTGAVDGDAVLSPTSIEVDPGMVVALGLRNWSDLDANEFAASEQDEWDVGATVWTVKVRRVDPDTQVVTWVDRPDLTRTGATYSFRVPCGGTYAIAGAVPDHGLLAKDSAPAAVTSTVTVLHPCGTNCGQ